MNSNQYSINKLNQQNYEAWRSDIKYILIERNVWSIVDESETEPKVKIIKADPLDPGFRDEKTDERIRDFKRRSNLALSLLYLNICEEFRRVIENFSDPVLAWKALKKIFRPDSRSGHMALFSELCSIRMMPEETIMLFSARLLRVFHRLKGLDKDFNEVYACYQLLRYLPTCYDRIVQSILSWKPEICTWVEIVNALNAEETRLKLRETDIVTQANATTAESHCYRCHQGLFQNPCTAERSRRSYYSPRRTTNQDPGKSYPSRRPTFSPERTSPVRLYKPNYSFQRNYPARSYKSNYSFRGSSPARSYKPNDNCRNYSPTRPKQHNGGGRSQKSYKPKQPRDCKLKPSFHYVTSSCLTSNICNSKSDWVFDSAASHHFCRERSYFFDYKPLMNEKLSVAVDGVEFPIEGKGTVKLMFGNRKFLLKEVMFSPKLKRNLLSGPRFDIHGFKFCGSGGEVKVSEPCGKLVFKATLREGIYHTSPKVTKCPKRVSFAAPAEAANNLELWHRRCAHIGTSTLVHTGRRNGVRGLPLFAEKPFCCEPCKISKYRRVSFKPLGLTRSKAPLDLLYADVWGPHSVRGKNGERFFLSIIDDFSRKVALYPMTEKSEVFGIVKSHITRVENFLDRRVKAFRSDNGSEFVNRQMENFFTQKGISHELTNTFTPEQNGVCERFNQTVASGARTVLNESGLPECFWPEAMLYFTYTWNRVCHSNLDYTPFELFGNMKPSVRHLRPFGVLAYVGVPKQHRKKLDARAKKGYLVGYAFKTKGYRVWVPELNKIIETINVSFREDSLFKDQTSGAVLGDDSSKSIIGIGGDDCPSNNSDPDPATVIPSSTDGDITPVIPIDTESRDIPLRSVDWLRKPVLRKDKSRTDVYYYEENKTQRLRSLNDVEDYCSKHNIVFQPELFNFDGQNSYSGLISDESPTSFNEDEGNKAVNISTSS